MSKQSEQPAVLRIDGIAIPLSAVSGTARASYELAAHEVATTPAGPMQNAAKVSDERGRYGNFARGGRQYRSEDFAKIARRIKGFYEAIPTSALHKPPASYFFHHQTIGDLPMATVRMLPTKASSTGWCGPNDNVAGRRYYTAVPGGFIDAIDVDATTLNSQGFAAIGDASGTTAQRPNTTYLRPGFLYLDTTLALIVAWDGVANWRNPVTGATATQSKRGASSTSRACRGS